MSQNNLETLLNELGLKTPVNAIQSESRGIIADFLKTEQEYYKQHKIKRLLRLSGIKQVKTLAQFDWQFNPRISKEDILAFSNSHWVRDASNLVLVGDTGLGKTHIAQALCYEAILLGFPTAFITAYDLISKIQKALNPATRIEYYAKMRVLCIDEIGYTFHKKEDTDVIFQIISKRSEILPTIVTTNLPLKVN
ncbi:MAG: ATP-binding protein [Nitrospirae bacterium]|nr:ATP-binding protein [Nitrospirota bacterium]